jgi:Luciferase-like monooxygenase
MLEEAVEVIRKLWEGGPKDHRGRHYRLEHARVYDLPEKPPPIVISGFGPKAVELAGRIGDGSCTVGPDAESVELHTPCGPDVDRHVEAIKAYEEAGFDELYVNQIGPEQDAFFEAYRERVLPRVR